MIQNQIYTALFCNASYGLYNRLEAISIIDNFNNGKKTKDLNLKELDELKDLIIKGRFNRYSDNDEDNSQNPFNDIDNSITREAYTNLAYYIAGKEISNREDFTLEELGEYEDNMEYGFFLGFTLNNKKEEELIRKATNDLDRILELSHSFEFTDNQLQGYCKKEFALDQTEEEIIAKLNHFNDGAYIELPGFVRFLGWLCLYEEKYDLWNLLFCKLQYAPLQGALTYQIRDMLTLQKVFDSIRSLNLKYKKVETFMLREHSLRITVDNTENLKNNLEDKLLTDNWKGICEGLLQQVEDNRKKYTSNIIGLSVDICGYDDTLNWIAKESDRWANNDSNVGKRYYSLTDFFKQELLKLKPQFNIDNNTNFQTLCLYAEMAVKCNLPSEECSRIIENLCKSLFTSNFINPHSLDNNTLDLIRNIYRTLEKSGCDGLALGRKYYNGFVGYNVDYTNAIQYYQRLCLWYSILILSVEENAKVGLLFDLTNELIARSSYLDISHEDAIVFPLHLCELLMSQVYKDEKDRYEKIIITEIPVLPIVLRILSGNDGVMSEGAKKLLKDRVNREWNAEKDLLKARKDRLLNFYDEYLNRLYAK